MLGSFAGCEKVRLSGFNELLGSFRHFACKTTLTAWVRSVNFEGKLTDLAWVRSVNFAMHFAGKSHGSHRQLFGAAEAWASVSESHTGRRRAGE